jgi:hypothetical protein
MQKEAENGGIRQLMVDLVWSWGVGGIIALFCLVISILAIAIMLCVPLVERCRRKTAVRDAVAQKNLEPDVFRESELRRMEERVGEERYTAGPLLNKQQFPGNPLQF